MEVLDRSGSENFEIPAEDLLILAIQDYSQCSKNPDPDLFGPTGGFRIRIRVNPLCF